MKEQPNNFSFFGGQGNTWLNDNDRIKDKNNKKVWEVPNWNLARH